MERRLGGTVPFPVPAEVAFDYLVDPRNRSEWQSSLRRVSSVVGAVGLGQSWTDETRPGLKPRLRTTEYDRPTRWSESGEWRSVRAELSLEFEDRGAASHVVYRFRVRVFGPVGLAITLLSAPAVGSDLRRAARILGSR
jgi:hypothetical protein